MKRVIRFLKQNKINDTRTINRLFVSAFLAFNNLKVERNLFLKSYEISEGTENDYLSEILVLIKKDITHIGLEELINLFEFVISPSDRIVSGAIYTPRYIRSTIIDTVFEGVSSEQLKRSKIADISCGCGGFLVDVSDMIHEKTGKTYKDIFHENIYGIDVEEYSIERTEIILSLLALMHGEDDDMQFHLLIADTLDFYQSTFNKDYKHFDFVVGNPPYVCSRNMSLETLQKLENYEICSWGHPDLYIPFIQIAVDCLIPNGRMGLITMNSFLNSLNGKGLREYLSSGNLETNIIDFRNRQIFQSKSTYTCLLFVTSQNSDSIGYINAEGELPHRPYSFHRIPIKELNATKGWNLNDHSRSNIIESAGIPLGDFCQSRHGIATLSNKTYVFRPSLEDDNYYYFESGNGIRQVEKTICRDIINSNKLNSDVDFFSLIEKIIFPYQIDERTGRVVVIGEDEMAAQFPFAYAYLQEQRNVLSERDKGHTENYPTWYAYGRTQSLVMPRFKLFFPKIANKALHCAIVDDPDLLLYNGMAFVSDSREKLELLKCFIESDTFWDYVTRNAKPYASGYFSLNGVNIKKFCIPMVTQEQKYEIIRETDTNRRNVIVKGMYH